MLRAITRIKNIIFIQQFYIPKNGTWDLNLYLVTESINKIILFSTPSLIFAIWFCNELLQSYGRFHQKLVI